MMDIENSAAVIRTNRVRITDHADEEAEADNLTFDEISVVPILGNCYR